MAKGKKPATKRRSTPAKRSGVSTTRSTDQGAHPRRKRVLGVLGLVLLVVASRVLILEGYGIDSESMEDSLLQGDLVLVERLSYGSEGIPDFGAPDVGDVVVFRRPEDGGVMVKRCVATAGQRVLIKNKVLHVDGVRAADPARSKYLDATIRPAKQSPRDHFGPYVVPPGHIFVLGDNRDASVDSRFFGPVSQPLLIGRAIAVLWPASRPNRWSRLGNGVD